MLRHHSVLQLCLFNLIFLLIILPSTTCVSEVFWYKEKMQLEAKSECLLECLQIHTPGCICTIQRSTFVNYHCISEMRWKTNIAFYLRHPLQGNIKSLKMRCFVSSFIIFVNFLKQLSAISYINITYPAPWVF